MNTGCWYFEKGCKLGGAYSELFFAWLTIFFLDVVKINIASKIRSANESDRIREDSLLVKTFFRFCFPEFQKIYDRLDVSIKERGESFYNDRMPKVVEELKNKGILFFPYFSFTSLCIVLFHITFGKINLLNYRLFTWVFCGGFFAFEIENVILVWLKNYLSGYYDKLLRQVFSLIYTPIV